MFGRKTRTIRLLEALLDVRDREIDDLGRRLGSEQSRPSFTEVSRRLDSDVASLVAKHALDRLVRDLQPILSVTAFDALRECLQRVHSSPYRKPGPAEMYVAVRDDCVETVQCRFRMPEVFHDFTVHVGSESIGLVPEPHGVVTGRWEDEGR